MIHFRPHHFLCTLGFKGKGYSEPFVKNFQKIVDEINADANTEIKVTCGLDSICAPCPQRQQNGTCIDQMKISELDRNHQQILEIEHNQVLTWSESKSLLRDKMTLEKFHSACATCEWKSLGYCESELRKLHE